MRVISKTGSLLNAHNMSVILVWHAFLVCALSPETVKLHNNSQCSHVYMFRRHTISKSANALGTHSTCCSTSARAVLYSRQVNRPATHSKCATFTGGLWLTTDTWCDFEQTISTAQSRKCNAQPESNTKTFVGLWSEHKQMRLWVNKGWWIASCVNELVWPYDFSPSSMLRMNCIEWTLCTCMIFLNNVFKQISGHRRYTTRCSKMSLNEWCA